MNLEFIKSLADYEFLRKSLLEVIKTQESDKQLSSPF